MQLQIQQKLNDFNALQEQLNAEQFKFAKCKGDLAMLKEEREEVMGKLEIYEAKQKVPISPLYMNLIESG